MPPEPEETRHRDPNWPEFGPDPVLGTTGFQQDAFLFHWDGERWHFTNELVIPFAFSVSGKKTDEGLVIQSVAIAWDALFQEIARDPHFLYTLDPRKLEELIAARYEKAGWKAILTPRSGDSGRDIIAVHEGLKVRIFDEVKRYKPGTRIDASIVRSLYGVISLDRNVSKGIVSTTADFAPGIEKEFAGVIPYRLGLRNGAGLANWMKFIGPELGL